MADPTPPPTTVPTVRATGAALEAVARLTRTHGDLIFVLSAGCCAGSAPMCFPLTDFHTGQGDILLGDVGGAPFYADRRHLRAWAHGTVVLDVEPGYPDGLSLGAGDGRHFITTSESAPSQ